MTQTLNNAAKEPTPRCGFVAVIGSPNAGKSTLINQMVGAKVSIVSPKVQTTRTVVRGIAQHKNDDNHAQIIFVDTPGIFTPQKGKRLERSMVAAAWQSSADADVVMLIVDVSRPKSFNAAKQILKRLIETEAHMHEETGKKARPVILVLNKIDQTPKEKLLLATADFNQAYPFDATFMVCATKGMGTDTILSYLAKTLPQGPHHFPEDEISDAPLRFLAAEITREKLFHRLHDELPYGLMVETESWENFENGDIKISQLITVERGTHKMIVLGKSGQQIKAIGTQARTELQEILETKVHLILHVRVQGNWQEDSEKYEAIGLHEFF
jgi:GTP-binding protein Era